jgi:hypothetical protein
MWFQPGPRLSCSTKGPTQFTQHGRTARCAAPLAAINRRTLCKHCLGVLALHTAPVVGCVISPIAAACNLLLWGTALPRNVILTRSNIQGMHIHSCAVYDLSAGSSCSAKGLSKQGTSPTRLAGCSIQSESALRHFRSPRYQQYKVWG